MEQQLRKVKWALHSTIDIPRQHITLRNSRLELAGMRKTAVVT